MSAERAARRPGPRPTAALLALAVAALACAVYLNSLANGFAMDDVAVIQRNDRLHSAGRLLEVLTTPYWPAKEPIASPYRPVTSLSFALNWAAGRGHPGAFHAVNVLLHAAVAALLLLLLLRLGLPAAAATLGAAVFALHPVHTEAVANIVGRAELLVACFVLLAALAYLRSTARPWLRIPAIALAYALALGSKENAIVLPALLVLLELFRPDRDRPLRAALWRERWVYIALILVTAGFAAVRYTVLGVFTSGDVAAYIAGLSTSSRIATALRIWPEYLRLLFYPRDLIADYGPGVIFPVTSWDPRVLAGFAIAAGSLALALVARRRYPWAAFAILWFDLTIFPVSNMLVPVSVWLAERTLYLPSVAASVLAAALAAQLLLRPRRMQLGAAAAAALLLSLGAWRTWTRNPTWRSTPAALLTLGREHPESFRPYWWLGEVLIRRGQVEEGLELYRQAYALVPTGVPLALDYSRQLLAAGRPAEAESVLRSLSDLVYADRYLYLTRSLIAQEKHLEARQVLEQGLEWYPRHPELLEQRERLQQISADTAPPMNSAP